MEQLALALWASVCGYQDIKRLRVSNWLILGGFLISFVYLYVKESSLTGATVNMAMTALFIGVCLSLPGYLLGRLGAADVKYLAALGWPATHLRCSIAWPSAACCASRYSSS